jgi:hypothetical protein
VSARARVSLVALALLLAVVAEYWNSLRWYLGSSGMVLGVKQLDGVSVELQEGWLRTKWDSHSMYFQKVDVFASDRVVGSFLITDDPNKVRRLMEASATSIATYRRFSWGDAFQLNDTTQAGIAPTVLLVPSLGVQISTQQPELLSEIIELKRNDASSTRR